jgi:diguanylate cyclase (GGDEF)-like protein/PAS domain S-box-containing protein
LTQRAGALGIEHAPATGIDYRSIVEASADLITVTGQDGRLRYVSAVCHRLFGWAPADLVGRPESDFVHPDDLPALLTSRAENSSKPAATTLRMLCRNGSWRWTETKSRHLLVEGAAVVVSSVRDISERQERTRALEQLALADPLTGVANRAALMDRLRQGLLRLRRGSGVLAVLYCDLDRFKVINDSLGHRVGDAVLLTMAERLTRHLRPADTLARLGGDEFVIVVEGITNESSVAELATRIIEAAREPVRVGEEEFLCTVSVGIATTDDSRRWGGDLLHEADLALYRAKDRGRDRAEIFDATLRTKAVDRLVTERIVRGAVDEGRVVVEYQPIIDLRSVRLVSAEALVRIREANGLLLRPESFLQVAEETGLLTMIDDQVIADAVHQTAGWRSRLVASGFDGVAINVTARHLADAGFHQAVVDLLARENVPPQALQIEVTERVLMEASHSTLSVLRALRESGLRVGLDDFGTGYSSLGYLRQFPLDFVKIDKLFVDDLARDSRERAIATAIIGLSHALGLIVIAEGVESPDQRRILEDLGCDRAQGFLFAPAGGPSAVDRLALSLLG